MLPTFIEVEVAQIDRPEVKREHGRDPLHPRDQHGRAATIFLRDPVIHVQRDREHRPQVKLRTVEEEEHRGVQEERSHGRKKESEHSKDCLKTTAPRPRKKKKKTAPAPQRSNETKSVFLNAKK
jgi:hypothetical protein